MGYLEKLKQDLSNTSNLYWHCEGTYVMYTTITKQTAKMIYYRFVGLDKIHRLKKENFFAHYKGVGTY